MAREEQDREDLLREATALVARVEFTLNGDRESIVVGFRRDGAASVFLGVDPVYQFNKGGQLRRAFRQGYLFKAENGRLIRLERRRSVKVVELLRHELTDEEQRTFIDEAVQRLGDLRARMGQGSCVKIGQVPAGQDVMQRVKTWLATLSIPLAIASTPRAGGSDQ